MQEIILASASPRRNELLQLIEPSFLIIPSTFDESTVEKWPPDRHVINSATGKAFDVAEKIDNGIVIGADTVVVVDEEILGKPSNNDDARRMLKMLSGRSHYVYTGLCVISRKNGSTVNILKDYVKTEVRFGELSSHIIDMYVETGEPLDKAGAYGIQERGSVLIEYIVGDYFNVVGLPIYTLSRILNELGIPLFKDSRWKE